MLNQKIGIDFTEKCGYYAYAKQNIPVGTFITEYVGEIGFEKILKTQEELLVLGNISNSKNEIVIATDKFANWGRFFLGLPYRLNKHCNCEF